MKKCIVGSVFLISAAILFSTRYIAATIIYASGRNTSLESSLYKFNSLLWLSGLFLALGIGAIVFSMFEDQH
jgi:ABC-type transport system involved in multi-copper enzyme maturation permease subunit